MVDNSVKLITSEDTTVQLLESTRFNMDHPLQFNSCQIDKLEATINAKSMAQTV